MGNPTVLATSTPCQHQQQPGPSQHNQQPPMHRMDRNTNTIDMLFREWYEGLAGGYSIVSLDERWGRQWRQDEKEKEFYNRRKTIIRTIERYAEDYNISTQTAINIAEEKRSRLKKTLHYLAENNDEIF